MKSKIIQELCRNLTALLGNVETDQWVTSKNETDLVREERDRHALYYIVVVLLFYSIGIIVAIVMYLKREKEEIEEEAAYENYMNFRADPGKAARFFSVQKMINLLQQVEKDRNLREKEAKKKEIVAELAGRPATLSLQQLVVDKSSKEDVAHPSPSQGSSILRSQLASSPRKNSYSRSGSLSSKECSSSPDQRLSGAVSSRSLSTYASPPSEQEKLLDAHRAASPTNPKLLHS